MRSLFLALATVVGASLAACDLSSQPSSGPSGSFDSPGSEDPAPDRHHLKTFFWDSTLSGKALPKALGTGPRFARLARPAHITRFDSREALGKALRTLQEELRQRGASDSLWKPLDHSCPEFELALWNRYGEVRLKDSLILDEALLKARCLPLSERDEAGSVPGAAGALSTGARAKTAAYATGESQHRVYPYKMIGRAWSDRDLLVTRSSGAETQFKKEREYFGVMGWWDTDATRIGVRLYLLDCGGSPMVCYSGGEKSNWHRNSASVLQTDFAGFGETRAQTAHLPAGLKRLNLKVSAAALALHSADHAGIRFRATSTSGISAATPLLLMPATEYVAW